MKPIEEQNLIKNVYVTARQELKHIQRCIEKMRIYWESLENQQDPMYKEIELFMIELHQAEKQLLNLLKKATGRMRTEHLDQDDVEEDSLTEAIDMNDRSQHIKHLIHKNKQAGIFAWELAKDLIIVERQLLESIGREW